ncbi:Uridine phosphorylase [Aquicella siphonis]|uniref:Uridine phosphorylase n=1 Tax=Aquicella siphonis TaxID=254247 RepID=A0A5E4PLP4_9COXI|nr:nucleoside phosphorylase [Aquicella siphonis]VVC77146.1 Uridine phosphorylase [Aquicella siphonis]
MSKQPFKPHHINADSHDLKGNGKIGRYILLPGSDGRAKAIAGHFDNLVIKPHPRGHHLYIGTIANGKTVIDVAVISTGMGCPSMEIILHELYHLGGKRFLRVGTAGSLQPGIVKIGGIVNAQASVRDEKTTTDYEPISIPAISSFEFTLAIMEAAKKLGIIHQIHTGMVHCKSSLYAREFGAGPEGAINKSYIDLLTHCGVLATEMETAALFVQSQIYNYQLLQRGKGPQYRVLCGAILGIISMPPHDFATPAQEAKIETAMIGLALESIKTLSASEIHA